MQRELVERELTDEGPGRSAPRRGRRSVTVNLAAGTVDFDGALDAAAVAATLAPHGYSAVPADGPATPEPASADHCCGSCHA